VAYLNPRDEYHSLAMEWMTTSTVRIVTTEWVLAELGDFLAEGSNRRLLGSLVRALSAEERVEIVPADHASFLNALTLYMRRPDKSWSFTDCTSFCLMKARKISEALTTDHHFNQGGFAVLLKL
jgi:predicted nucleic acid-binding protein